MLASLTAAVGRVKAALMYRKGLKMMPSLLGFLMAGATLISVAFLPFAYHGLKMLVYWKGNIVKLDLDQCWQRLCLLTLL